MLPFEDRTDLFGEVLITEHGLFPFANVLATELELCINYVYTG